MWLVLATYDCLFLRLGVLRSEFGTLHLIKLSHSKMQELEALTTSFNKTRLTTSAHRPGGYFVLEPQEWGSYKKTFSSREDHIC